MNGFAGNGLGGDKPTESLPKPEKMKNVTDNNRGGECRWEESKKMKEEGHLGGL